MASAYVKDNTPDSMTKDKPITIPVTILECPSIKIFSVRFYKDNKVSKDILAETLDKELKRKVKLPNLKLKSNANKAKLDSVKLEDYDNVTIIAYSQVKTTGLKKKPDLVEIGLTGANVEEKLAWVKENINREISALEIFEANQLVDLRGLTRGRGLVGPVKRFGIKLKASKSEKGRRRPGNIGPWHPARVTFRIPMAGQLGMFTRAVYNNKIVSVGKASENPIKNVKNYGDVKTDYIIVRGSIQGPAKRQLVMTAPLRTSKKQDKKNFELVRLM